jgi:hypothetical protein
MNQSEHVTSRTILAVALRWTARAWGVASGLLLLAFAFGGNEHLRFTAGEAIAFLLFPVGVIAGFVIAWSRELAGGLTTVGCFLLFSILLMAWSGRPPGIYFFLFVAPGFLHIASAFLSRSGAVSLANAHGRQ